MTEARPAAKPTDSSNADMLWIRGGEFLMGSDSHYPEEAP
ncbi:MAG: formylglycine-generating enzyme family protein, partial [Mesorhizobium sp.]